MRILVTNDDGIYAPGVWALAEAMVELGKVSVVAPDRDQSGIGTARTLLTVLRIEEAESKLEGVTAHSVSGTPSDCVILADGSLFPSGSIWWCRASTMGRTWGWTFWTRALSAAR